MYALFGFAHNIQNVFKLAAPYANAQIETVDDLAVPFQKFLTALHKDMPINTSSDQLIINPQTAAKLSGAFAGSRINDLHQERMVNDLYTGDELLNRAEMARHKIHALRELNKEVGELFRLCVHSVLLANSASNNEGLRAHGGSSNRCIGLVWLSLHAQLSTQDIVEMLIHELAHTLVFVDELSNGHFHYESMTKKENWAQSSILKRNRPMDKVVHSIVVATEIINARIHYLPNVDTLTVHPGTAELKLSALRAIDSVLNHSNLEAICQPRAIELVRTAREYVRNV